MPVILKSHFVWQNSRLAFPSWCYGASSFGGAVYYPLHQAGFLLLYLKQSTFLVIYGA